LLPEVALRSLAQIRRPSTDEEYRHSKLTSPSRERQRRWNRLRLTKRLKTAKTAGALLQIAAAVDDAPPPVGAIGRPIGKRGLIDVEHNRWLHRRFCSFLQPRAGCNYNFGDILVVTTGADVLVDLPLILVEIRRDRPVVLAKNSIGDKEWIIHASVERPKDLLNGGPLHI
jgi:hypothetical protein